MIKKYNPDISVKIPINPNIHFIQHNLKLMVFGVFHLLERKNKSIMKFIKKISPRNSEKDVCKSLFEIEK
jgi:hypothetical protein